MMHRTRKRTSIIAGVLFSAVLPMPIVHADQAADQQANQTATFGDVVVRYSAISTNQLFPEVAKSYGIQRSSRNGLVNIAVQKKDDSDIPQLISAMVSGNVGDLTGHPKPIAFRETKENGDVDYLGEFPLNGSGTYVFDIKVTLRGQTQPLVVKFNRDYVVD